MIVKIDDHAKAAIEAILKRGNDAIIRRKGDCVIVMEKISNGKEPPPKERRN